MLLFPVPVICHFSLSLLQLEQCWCFQCCYTIDDLAEFAQSVHCKFRAIPSDVWQALNDDLRHQNWPVLNMYKNANDALALFDRELHSAFSWHLSSFHVAHNGRKISPTLALPFSPPWLTANLRLAVKRKHDLYSVYREFPTTANVAAYKTQRNLVKYMSCQSHRQYIQSVQSTHVSPDRPNLYRFVHQQRRTHVNEAPRTMIAADGSSVFTAKAIADTLNNALHHLAFKMTPQFELPQCLLPPPYL